MQYFFKKLFIQIYSMLTRIPLLSSPPLPSPPLPSPPADMSQLGHQMQHHQDPALQQLAASVHSLTNPQGPLMAGIQACLQQESATSLQQ